MKRTNKLLSVIMIVALALSLAVPAFAAGGETIAINKAVDDGYKVYKVLYTDPDTTRVFPVEGIEYGGESSPNWSDYSGTDFIAAVEAAIAAGSITAEVADNSSYDADDHIFAIDIDVSDSNYGYCIANANGKVIGNWFRGTADPVEIVDTVAHPGVITVNNAVDGQVYKIYQILDLESYNTSTDAYAYKLAAGWENFMDFHSEVDGSTAGSLSVVDYLKKDSSGYVTWNPDTVKNATNLANFAMLAKAYADKNNIAPVDSKTATSTTIVFAALDLGYYLLDSSMGVLCSLDTTDPTVTIQEKNKVPTVKKEVLEDSTGNWGSENDADLGEIVQFRTTITIQDGAQNYVLHDKMSNGLYEVYVESVTINGKPINSGAYTITQMGLGDGCSFEISFETSYTNELEAGTEIVVAYRATVSVSNAAIGLAGNPNETWLTYGDNATVSNKATTTTYVWDMDILKYGNGNEGNVLSGAKFALLNAAKTHVAQISDGKFIQWVKIEDGIDVADYALTTGTDGKIAIDGLDADTYYLRETEAPDGYNKLASDTEVKITGKNTDGDEATYTTFVAKINNNSGTELPETGGIGTTIFYICGGLMVLAAVVVLVSKRRMSTAE